MPALAAKAICDNMDQYLSGSGKHYGICALNRIRDLLKDGMTAEEHSENLSMFRFSAMSLPVVAFIVDYIAVFKRSQSSVFSER